MWKRLTNLWKGFLSLWISDIEKEHPEIAYENAINSMVAKYSKLKTATAGIIRRREELDERYKRATTELAQTEAELETAAVGLRQLAAHVGVDQVRFRGFQGAQVVPVRKRTVLHLDLLLFRQVSQEVLDLPGVVSALQSHRRVARHPAL